MPSKKPKSGAAAKGGGKRKRTRVQTWKSYIFNLLKSARPDLGISRIAMQIVNQMMDDAFVRIAAQAKSLLKMSQKTVLGSEEIYTSVQLLFPKELKEPIINAAVTATRNFAKSRGKKPTAAKKITKRTPWQNALYPPAYVEDPPLPNMR